MDRPIGSPSRQKPFADALRMEICDGNDHRVLRALARIAVRPIPEIWRGYQKRPRPKRLLITSIRDSLVTGSFACTEGTGGASAGGADR